MCRRLEKDERGGQQVSVARLPGKQREEEGIEKVSMWEEESEVSLIVCAWVT